MSNDHKLASEDLKALRDIRDKIGELSVRHQVEDEATAGDAGHEDPNPAQLIIDNVCRNIDLAIEKLQKGRDLSDRPVSRSRVGFDLKNTATDALELRASGRMTVLLTRQGRQLFEKYLRRLDEIGTQLASH